MHIMAWYLSLGGVYINKCLFMGPQTIIRSEDRNIYRVIQYQEIMFISIGDGKWI